VKSIGVPSVHIKSRLPLGSTPPIHVNVLISMFDSIKSCSLLEWMEARCPPRVLQLASAVVADTRSVKSLKHVLPESESYSVHSAGQAGLPGAAGAAGAAGACWSSSSAKQLTSKSPLLKQNLLSGDPSFTNKQGDSHFF